VLGILEFKIKGIYPKHMIDFDIDFENTKCNFQGLIDSLRALDEKIKHLKNKKQLAVENEDYDTAKSCKVYNPSFLSLDCFIIEM